MVICMRANAGIFIFILLLLLVGTAGAYLPDKILFASNPEWVIANNVDQSTITVTIMNQSNNLRLSGSSVTFNVTDPQFGTINPLTVTTDSNGVASSIFKAKTKSGNAIIGVSVTNGTDSNTFTIFQNIDHEVPDKADLQYPFEGEVGSNVTFNISVTDRWGNPIDDRNPSYIHTVSFRVDCPENDCGIVDGAGGYPRTLSQKLETTGNLSMQIRLSNISGDHNIQVASPFSLALIKGIASGNPYRMTGTISDGGMLEVDTTSFTIEYFLYDANDNPVRNQSVWVNISPSDEQKKYTSNSLGQIRLYYGPKSAANRITIYANSTGNLSVTNIMYAEFVSSEPTNMVLAITPATMPSREVAPAIKAFVKATVIDMYGNPVPDQTVSFQIKEINTGEFIVNETPSFSSSSEVSSVTVQTKADGNTEVFFYPGSFVMRSQTGYSNLSTGSCIIEAQWTSADGTIHVTRDTPVFWKNYPYLSIQASTSKNQECVRLNDTFDVAINVTGDGYAMGAPVTALLVMDCSANMFLDKGRRINETRAAAKVFIDHMNQGQDYVGLTSYGTDENLKWDLPPQPSLDLVKLNLDQLQKGNKAEFNQSIFRAIKNITDTQPTRPMDVVRAVIILADPGGIGLDEEEILAIQMAANHTVPLTHIFSIYYDNGTATTDKAEKTMIQLPNGTGNSPGRFYKPTNPEELADAYFNISETLHLLAGVNTTMNINSQNIQVNTTEYMPGGQVFDYVPVGLFADLNLIPAGQPLTSDRTRIIWPNTSQSVINQSDDWTSDHQLNFTIGSINIKERWQATYRLKANQTGLIRIFDNSSTLSFNDGNDTLQFPDIYISVCPDTTPESESGALRITNLTVTSADITDYIPLAWDLNYEGRATATETLFYSYNNTPWIQFDTRADIEPANYYRLGELDIRQSLPGSYRIKVHAIAPEGEDEQITGPIMVGENKAQIKLD